jgi:hypothetical protein|tara:strand:+ start:103 stop:231 length:129 start_codon:yes stop_codon:yes gene_type:complete
MIMAIIPSKVIPPPIPIIADKKEVKKAAMTKNKFSVMNFQKL